MMTVISRTEGQPSSLACQLTSSPPSRPANAGRRGRLFVCSGDAMPNRVIRDSALASKKLATVSAEAERLFWRLLMVADDFGRFQAEPSILLARCFPLQVKDYSVKQVSRWYAELTRCGAIIGYEVGGDSFGQFLVWNQRSRAEKSKYPPSDDGQVTVIRPSAAHVDEDVDVD